MLDVALIQFVVIGLDGALELLLAPLVLLELLRYVLLLLLLPLMEFPNTALVVNVAQPAPAQVPTRLEIIVLLGLGLHRPQQAPKTALASEQAAAELNVHHLIQIDLVGQVFAVLHQAEDVLGTAGGHEELGAELIFKVGQEGARALRRR